MKLSTSQLDRIVELVKDLATRAFLDAEASLTTADQVDVDENTAYTDEDLAEEFPYVRSIDIDPDDFGDIALMLSETALSADFVARAVGTVLGMGELSVERFGNDFAVWQRTPKRSPIEVVVVDFELMLGSSLGVPLWGVPWIRRAAGIIANAAQELQTSTTDAPASASSTSPQSKGTQSKGTQPKQSRKQRARVAAAEARGQEQGDPDEN